MNVLMLGTGSADGWPSPFCTCASCNTLRARGEIRGQTSALIDDRLLIDCGPEAARSAERAGRALTALKAVLFTHAHPDHCDGQFLMWRSWEQPDSPLIVAGPSDALDRVRTWLPPDEPTVTWMPLVAGDEVAIDQYSVQALAASHTAGALVYCIQDPDGARLLYATDTGPLPAATLSALRDTSLQAVFLENTWGAHVAPDALHHDLTTFATTIAALRDLGAVVDSTQFIAIHLGHRNPPEPELSRQLSAWGARAAADHEEFDVGASDNEPMRHPFRTLITGGARSGKSREAERIVAADPVVIYVATAPLRVDDDEWATRISEHQRRRPSSWDTQETRDIVSVLDAAEPGTTGLVDCLTLWLTGIIDDADAWDGTDANLRSVVDPAIDALVAALGRSRARVVLVTNEVGSGVVPESRSGRAFRDLLGSLNARVARACESVLLVVAGHIVDLTPNRQVLENP